MSRGINKVTLLGHLGKDPEIRSTPGGTIIATFSLATSDRRKDQQGEWQDQTEWHNLVAFNRTAEICRDYLSKGSQIHVEGKIQTRSWEDKESGEKKYRTEILVNELIMLGGASGDQSSNGRQAQPVAQRATEANVHGQYISDDDIPF
jgi:single-strand DNA-binding protein